MQDYDDSVRARCEKCKEFIPGYEKELHELLKPVVDEIKTRSKHGEENDN